MGKTAMNYKYLYVGSYSEKGKPGIYLFDFDPENGKADLKRTFSECDNPSFLLIEDEAVYAVNELEEKSRITAFKRDTLSGELTKTGELETDGTYACHIGRVKGTRFLSVANYGDGRFEAGSLVTIDASGDGSNMKICSNIRLSGEGFLNSTRQECSHIHSTKNDPQTGRLYVADLGFDKVYAYEVDEKGQAILSGSAMQIDLPKGEGPRHFVFSDDARYVYIVAEMGSRVFVYAKNEADSIWELKQQISTISDDYRKMMGETGNKEVVENTASEIAFSHDGRYLYVANRGENTIVCFEVNKASGELEFIKRFDCGGDFPRHFCITPDDKYMVVADQNSGNIVVFKRNTETGALEDKTCDYEIKGASFVGFI
ncbi:MAG: lactonase family protein [Butyrivibrio sp.]|nr:lactonase family protein [Butyrivibrio sp.]